MARVAHGEAKAPIWGNFGLIPSACGQLAGEMPVHPRSSLPAVSTLRAVRPPRATGMLPRITLLWP